MHDEESQWGHCAGSAITLAIESESPGENVSWRLAGIGCQDPAQMADFVVHFRGVRDGLGDLIAKEAAVALPEAMDQAFHGRFGHPQCLR